MTYPTTEKLILPVEPYQVGGYAFGERLRRRFGVPAIHLGEDVLAAAGAAVRAIGEGKVVLAKMLPGSEEKRSWGGVVVLEHQRKKAQSTKHKHDTFYSIYGHVRDLQVKEGDVVNSGQQIGSVAAALTPENGWWKNAHLHFGIYTGPWRGEILPGWWRPEHFWRTRLSWWEAPQRFFAEYSGPAA